MTKMLNLLTETTWTGRKLVQAIVSYCYLSQGTPTAPPFWVCRMEQRGAQVGSHSKAGPCPRMRLLHKPSRQQLGKATASQSALRQRVSSRAAFATLMQDLIPAEHSPRAESPALPILTLPPGQGS